MGGDCIVVVLLQYRAHWGLVVDGSWKLGRDESTDIVVHGAEIISLVFLGRDKLT